MYGTRREWLFVLTFLPVFWLFCYGMVYVIGEIEHDKQNRSELSARHNDAALRQLFHVQDPGQMHPGER
jgi:hypothetical protein